MALLVIGSAVSKTKGCNKFLAEGKGRSGVGERWSSEFWEEGDIRSYARARISRCIEYCTSSRSWLVIVCHDPEKILLNPSPPAW